MNYICTLKDIDIFPKKDLGSIPEIDWEKRRTVKILIINETKEICLVTNPIHGFYLLPGGGIEKNETIFSATKREALEETGCYIKPIEIVGKTQEYRARDKKHYETTGVFATVIKKVGRDRRTLNEKNIGLMTVWLKIDKAQKIFSEQEKLLRSGNVVFYNTGFNIVRDKKIFECALKKIL